MRGVNLRITHQLKKEVFFENHDPEFLNVVQNYINKINKFNSDVANNLNYMSGQVNFYELSIEDKQSIWRGEYSLIFFNAKNTDEIIQIALDENDKLYDMHNSSNLKAQSYYHFKKDCLYEVYEFNKQLSKDELFTAEAIKEKYKYYDFYKSLTDEHLIKFETVKEKVILLKEINALHNEVNKY